MRRSNLFKNIALVITDKETNVQIKKLDVGLLELRADLFKNTDPAYIVDQIKKRKLLKIPLLLTVRNQKEEGAVKQFSDEKKWQIIAAALPLVDMIDIELSSPLLRRVIARSKATKQSFKIIISSHYLKGMPRDLEIVLKKSLSAGADIVKIAAKANSFDDVMRMLNFTHKICHSRASGNPNKTSNLITMSLGPVGAISRLVLPAAGSLYTYTFLNKPTASGQVDVKTLKSHMKIYFP